MGPGATQLEPEPDLEEKQAAPEFWNDQERAQKLMRERTRLKNLIDTLSDQSAALDDAEVLDADGDEITAGGW